MRAPVEQGKQFYGVVFNITANDVNRRKMGQQSRETVSLDMNPFINGFIFK